MVELKLVAGLGNPGAKYEQTRHNAGFRAVDRLAGRWRLRWKTWPGEALVSEKGPGGVLLVKPQSFMNNSGRPLKELAQYYRIAPSEMLVILDDFALPLGMLRLRASGSAGSHNGLSSIVDHFGTPDIPRLRLGIGPLPPRIDPADFVLSPFRPEEQEAVERMADAAADVVERIGAEGWEKAVSRMPGKISRDEDDLT